MMKQTYGQIKPICKQMGDRVKFEFTFCKLTASFCVKSYLFQTFVVKEVHLSKNQIEFLLEVGINSFKV